MQNINQDSQIMNNTNFTTGLQQANFQKAMQEKVNNSNRFYKGKQVSWRQSLAHFKIYGTGIYLFFAFIKHASVLFLILTIVSLPPIILNVVKNVTFIHSQNSLSIILTRTSLGSHKYSLMPNSPYSISIAYKIVNVVFDVIGCLIFLFFCLYWQRKSHNIAKHIQSQNKTQSSHTIQVVQFPSDIKEAQMTQFMGKFGKITEVIAARDYTKQISLSKQIYQLEMQIKELQFQSRIQVNSNNKDKIMKLTQQVQNKYQKLDKTETRSHQIAKFYVQYQTPQQRNKVLKKFQPYQKFCKCFTQRPQQLCLKGQPVIISKCNTQPIGILWQNAHFNWKLRIPRAVLQAIIILAIVVGGFIFISFLNILVPPIDTNVDTSNLSYDQVKTSDDQSIKKAWCIQNFDINGKSSAYFQLCQNPWKLYINATVISVCISLILMILCEIIKKVVELLADFQCYTTQTEKSVNIMTNLFIMNFLTTTLITFLMQANIFGLSVLLFLKSLVTSPDLINNINSIDQYSDLIPSWYKDIGYQIWFNIFIMIFVPQLIQPPALYLYEYLMEKLAMREKIHSNMVKRLQSLQFQFQEQYANLLLIIATGFIFGGGIQLMMIVVFLCFFIRYFYLKYIFIRFSRVPTIHNEIINDRVILILKIILLFRCLISVYMYGAQDVFAMETSQFMRWASTLGVAVFSSVFIVLSRALLTWYYSVFIIIIILVLIFKEPIFGGVKKFKEWRKKNKSDSSIIIPEKSTINIKENKSSNSLNINKNLNIKASEQNIIPNPSNQLESVHSSAVQSWLSHGDQQVKSQRKATKSYSLQNNPLYQQVIIIMKMKKTKDLMKKSQISKRMQN